MNPWLSLFVALVVARLLLALTNACHRRWRLRPETSRKMLHTGMGLTLAACPWLFGRAWPVLALCGIFVGLLVARLFVPLLRRHVAHVIYGVDRPSHGEFYFPLAVAALFVLSDGRPPGRAVLFCAPVLTMALADTAAALVGGAYGRCRYRTPGGVKSVEGSAAFFAVAFLVTHVALLLGSEWPRGQTLGVAAAVAMALTPLEAVAGRGLDNLLVPLASFGLLEGMGVAGNAGAAVAVGACGLAVFLGLVAWGRRSAAVAPFDSPAHSGNGLPLVSGASQMTSIPTT